MLDTSIEIERNNINMLLDQLKDVGTLKRVRARLAFSVAKQLNKKPHTLSVSPGRFAIWKPGNKKLVLAMVLEYSCWKQGSWLQLSLSTA